MCQAQDSKRAGPRPDFAFMLDLPPQRQRPGASSFAILHTWQRWHLCWCKATCAMAPQSQNTLINVHSFPHTGVSIVKVSFEHISISYKHSKM